MIFDLGPICIPEKRNRAKYHSISHWKLRWDRAFILTNLDSPMVRSFHYKYLVLLIWPYSRCKLELKMDQEVQTWGTSCGQKNLSFSECFLWHLCNYQEYLWLKFQLNWSLFVWFIAPKSPKMGPIGSLNRKLDRWSYCRLCENSVDPLARFQWVI